MKYDYEGRIQDWKKIGFNPSWIIDLANEPATSKTSGLSGMTSCSVMRTLEGAGCIKRGPIQKNHLRLWKFGPQHHLWVQAIKAIEAEAST